MHRQNDNIIHAPDGKGSTDAVGGEAQQGVLTFDSSEILTNSLMPQVASIENLKRAFRAVKRNKGAPGIDNMSIKETSKQLAKILPQLQQQLRNGSYRPSAVKQIEIPKPSGGTRTLGIPTVVDRTVAQAVAQVLTPIFDPTFSDSSFGFRPKRNAKQAIERASDLVAEGREYVVDIDLEKFFDRVNQDKLMHLVALTIKDKELLRLIRRFLNAGVMQDGLRLEKEEGTVQGSPLSPLLSNIMLHQLDKELERRGHEFCRYADDCNIYVHSQKAADRVLKSISAWIEKRLKLKVNKTKSAAGKVQKRKFLGFNIRNDGAIAIDNLSTARLKGKIRKITKRNRGVSLKKVIADLNLVIRGWFHYFKCSTFKTIFKNIDAWIRRRLRCFRIKQRKRKYSIKTFLQARGVNQQDCWSLACSDKGWWRKALNPVAHRALPAQWFRDKGLFSLLDEFGKHQSETAVCDIACTVV